MPPRDPGGDLWRLTRCVDQHCLEALVDAHDYGDPNYGEDHAGVARISRPTSSNEDEVAAATSREAMPMINSGSAAPSPKENMTTTTYVARCPDSPAPSLRPVWGRRKGSIPPGAANPTELASTPLVEKRKHPVSPVSAAGAVVVGLRG